MIQQPLPNAEPLVAEIVECLEYRLTTLDFLARMYQGELQPQMLASVLEGIRQWPPSDPDESPGQALLRSFATRSLDVDTERLATELAAEYVAMFFSSWRRVVSPYESVYISRDHVLMQEPAAQLARLYAEEGLELGAEFKEPADHIALELAFLSHLCARSLAAAQEGELQAASALVVKQQAFLKRHLLTWGLRFCRDLADLTESDFYRGLAWLTTELLDSELSTMDELQKMIAQAAEGGPRT